MSITPPILIKVLYSVLILSVLVSLYSCTDTKINVVSDLNIANPTLLFNNNKLSVVDISSLYEGYINDTTNIYRIINLCHHYTVHSKFDSSLFFSKKLMTISEKYDNPIAKIYANLYMGQSYLLSYGNDSIKTYLNEALSLADSIQDTKSLCQIYNALGIYTTTSVRCDENADGKEIKRNEELFNRIEELVITNKLYCNSGFSSEKLAEILNTNRTYISKAINSCSGKNFNSYINNYRIQEAIIILSDINNKTPLKVISHELGYNNIQTFYSSFQTEIGIPPSKFREKSIPLCKR